MTRFARKKSAKGDTRREPEESTPWAAMRNQMMDGGKRKDQAGGVEDLDDCCDLAEDEKVDVSQEEGMMEVDQDIEKANDRTSEDSSEDEDENGDDKSADSSKAPLILEEQDDVKKAKKKRQRKKDKCLNCKEKGHMKMNCPKLSLERQRELQELVKMKQERAGKGTGRKKKNKNNKSAEGFLSNKKVEDASSSGNNQSDKENGGKSDSKKSLKKKFKKIVKDKTGTIVAEGEGLFDGFRVKLEDVKRLKELKSKLLNGVSGKDGQKEVMEQMKLERRRAEKELVRSKKMVCFNCRKPGHLVAECPEGNISKGQKSQSSGGSAESKCFKCGALDHTSKTCESKRKGEDAYAFAVCFICKETGHLAKACPDNPKGLYPKGGGCRFCGSVVHLKSDCPRKLAKDQRGEVTAERTTKNGGSLLEVEVDEGNRKRKAMTGNSNNNSSSGNKRPKVVNF